MVTETTQVTEANATAEADAAAAVAAAESQLTEETVRDDPDAKPDPAEVAANEEREAWREAERARLRVEETDKIREEHRAAAAEAAAEAADKAAAAAFDTAREQASTKLRSIPFHLADGTPARLTDAQLNDILDTYDKAATKSLEIASRRVYQGLGEATAPLLGKEAADALQAKAGGKAIDVWLTEFGESYAAKSKHLTAMSDEAAAALVKSTPALAAVIKAAELREFKRGQKTPVEGEPERAEQGRAGSTVQPKSRLEADEMFAGSHKSGRKITLSELRAYRSKLSA